MSKVISKEVAEEFIDSITIIIDRLTKLSELIPEPTDRAEQNKIIDELDSLTKKTML